MAAQKGGHGRSHGHKNAAATGLTRTRGRFDYLSTLREEQQRKGSSEETDSCAIRRFIAIRLNPAESRQPLNYGPRRSGSTAFVTASDGIVGHQAHLQ